MNSQRNVRLMSGISVLCFLIFLPHAAAQDGSAATSTADSTDLDSTRKIAEAAYRAAEEASQQAAREYRAEAAQKSPDVKALAEFKQKLNSAVKAAFEAQMKLQQVRLQIAQRDLADVQAKHQRRESLASKIIERRVADLMKSEDLEWPQIAVPEELNLPRYNGQTIDYWLMAYRLLKEQSIQNNAFAEVMAIKTLQNDPSSDRSIQRFLAEQWEFTKTEVNRFHAGQKLASMIEVGGPRHREILLDYLLLLSGQMTEATDFHDLELKVSWGLKPAAAKLSIWNEEPAKQIAEKLQNGTSKQRLGAIAVIAVSLSEIAVNPESDDHEFRVAVRTLTPALIAASKDQLREVRILAILLASPFVHATSEAITEAYRGRLKEICDSDPDQGVRENAVSLLAATSNSVQSGDKPPNFATPRELIDHVETFFSDVNEASVEHYVELLTDDEVKRFSGFLLRTHSTLKAVAGLMTTFGSNDPDGDAFDVMSLTTALGLSIEKHRLSNPPAGAESAYQQITEGFNVLQLFSPSPPKPAIDADVYSNLLRTASGVLKEPKAFLRDAMSEMKALAKNSEKKDDAAAKPKEPAEWQVTVVGDTATAVNVAAESDESSPLGMAQTMELVKVGNTWKISSIIPDRVIIEMQQGMTATSSTSNSSDNSDGAKQPSVSRSYPEPVEHIVGTNATVAKSDIRAYSELSDSNVTTSTAYSDKQKPSALSKSSAVGRYLNRHLKKGEMITAEMLIEKPTTEQIVDLLLKEAAQRRVVFRHPYQYFTREPSLSASVIPYDNVSSARDFNKSLPEWTDEFLQGVHERLNARPQELWTPDDINLLWSISDVIFFQRKSDSRNLKPIGELLSSFVGIDNEALSKIADASVRKDAHSALILGEAVRINGSLPNNVLELRPTNDAILGKLNLLQQMVENGADDKWIGQEQIRLADLLNEAPVQAVKLLLTSAPIQNQRDLEHWIFAMAPNATYRAWRSSPPGDYSPPMDPVITVAVAELLVGNDEMTDNNLALLFEQHHPGYMFSRHLDDLLASELACRDNMLESLVTIYRFSKSTALKANITMVAPSVPVLARKLDGDVGLLLDKDGRMVHWGNAYPIRRDAESLYRFLRDTTVARISISDDSKITRFALPPQANRRSLAAGLRAIVNRFPQTCIMRHPEPASEGTPDTIMLCVLPFESDPKGAGDALAAQMVMEAIANASIKFEDTTECRIPDSMVQAEITASALAGDKPGPLELRLEIGEPRKEFDFLAQTHSIPIAAGEEKKKVLAVITDWLQKKPETRLFMINDNSRQKLSVAVPPREAFELATLVLAARVESHHGLSSQIDALNSAEPSHYGLYFDPVDISFDDLIPQNVVDREFTVEDLPALRQQLKMIDRCRVRLTGFATDFSRVEKTATHFAMVNNPDARNSLSESITSRISVDMAPGKTIAADDHSRVTVVGVLEINEAYGKGEQSWLYLLNFANVEEKISRALMPLPGLQVTATRRAVSPKVGEEFDIELTVLNESDSEIQDFRVAVSFPSSILEVTGATPAARSESNQTVVFHAISSIKAGEQRLFNLKCKAIGATPRSDVSISIQNQHHLDSKPLLLPITIESIAGTRE